jgi:hypothetical protein
MDSGLALRAPRNDGESVAHACLLTVIASVAKQSRIFRRWDSGLLRRCAPRNDGGESYTGNRAAVSSSGSFSPFARYDTVR